VPFVEPIPDIPNIEDCFIPDVPDPIFDGPPTQVPIIGTPGPIGPAGPAGADGADGTPGQDGQDGDSRCPQIFADVLATCDGEPTFASVTVIELADEPGVNCGVHMSFQFSLCQGPQGPQGPQGICPQCQDGAPGPQGPQGPPGVCQCEIQGCWVDVVSDFRIEGLEVQLKTRRIRVLECTDETDWITIHTGTTCQS